MKTCAAVMLTGTLVADVVAEAVGSEGRVALAMDTQHFAATSPSEMKRCHRALKNKMKSISVEIEHEIESSQ